MRYPHIATVLRNFGGLSVVLEPGWETRGSDEFDPEGIVNHHTAGGVGGGAHAELAHIRNDNLAQLYICRNAEVHVVGCGRANHAGLGLDKVLQDVKQDIAPKGDAKDVYGSILGRGLTTKNRWYWGIEVENNGTGEPYPDHQLDTLVRVNAAICMWQGWTHNRCIHHRESTSRKIDMSWRGDLRWEVKTCMEQALPAPAPDPGWVFVKSYDDDDLGVTVNVWKKSFTTDKDGRGYVDLPCAQDDVIGMFIADVNDPPAGGYQVNVLGGGPDLAFAAGHFTPARAVIVAGLANKPYTLTIRHR